MQTNRKVSEFFKAYGTMLAGAVIIVVFSVMRPDAFFTISNLINISRQISLLVVIALGATLVLVMDEFDLSLGALASLGGVVGAKLAVAGYPIFLCFLASVAVCAAIGFASGWLVTKFGVLSFITTLAMSTILSGLVFWITGGATVFQNVPKSFGFVGSRSFLSVPLLTWIMLALTVLFWFIMRHTAYGRKLYAIGGNKVASQVAGINVKRNKNIAFAISAGLAGLTGVLLASRLGSAHPTGGDGLFLQAYAAAFLGRTVFKEGVANIWGTLVGAIILGVLANGLTILQVPTFLQDLLTGCIIILAVVIQKIGHGESK